jgi:hypothetical protein
MELSGIGSVISNESELLVQGALVENGDPVIYVPANLDVLVEIDLRVRTGIGLKTGIKDLFLRSYDVPVVYDVKFVDGTRHRKQAYK